MRFALPVALGFLAGLACWTLLLALRMLTDLRVLVVRLHVMLDRAQSSPVGRLLLRGDGKVEVGYGDTKRKGAPGGQG